MNTSGFNITAVFIPVDYDNPVREIQIDSSNGFHRFVAQNWFFFVCFVFSSLLN